MKPYQKKITRIPRTERSNQPWTKEERATLRDMYLTSEATLSEIARELGRSRTAVQAQVYQYDLHNIKAAALRKTKAEQVKKAVKKAAQKSSETLPPLPPLTGEQQDAKLKAFRLYDGVFDAPKDEPKPSLWQRVKNLLGV